MIPFLFVSPPSSWPFDCYWKSAAIPTLRLQKGLVNPSRLAHNNLLVCKDERTIVDPLCRSLVEVSHKFLESTRWLKFITINPSI